MAIKCDQVQLSAITCRRSPGMRVIVRSGRSARMARTAVKLPSWGKSSANQPAATTKESIAFQPSAR